MASRRDFDSNLVPRNQFNRISGGREERTNSPENALAILQGILNVGRGPDDRHSGGGAPLGPSSNPPTFDPGKILGPSDIPGLTNPSFGPVPAAPGGGGGFWGGLGDFFKSTPGLLALQAGLGALGGAFGGDDNEDPRQPFTGPHTNPETLLSNLMQMLAATGQGIANRGQPQVRTTATPISGINVPGIPFSIGGGGAEDPMKDDPTLGQSPLPPLDLSMLASIMAKFQNPNAPGQAVPRGGTGSAATLPPREQVRRRNPGA